MAKINGTLVLFTLGGDTLAHVDNCTWNSSFTLAQATDKDSGGFMEYLEQAGLKEASLDINGNADFVAASGNVKELAEALDNRQNLAFVFGPTASGSVQFSGNCLISDHSIDTPNEETTTFTATATVNGDWTIDTVS
jgi:hypothetical protein